MRHCNYVIKVVLSGYLPSGFARTYPCVCVSFYTPGKSCSDLGVSVCSQVPCCEVRPVEGFYVLHPEERLFQTSKTTKGGARSGAVSAASP